MFIFVLGGAASGKSEYAESLCETLGVGKKKLYIATMESFGEDAKYRIKRHKSLRAGKGFDTLEQYRNLDTFREQGYEVAMLECMSTLLANEFFASQEYESNILDGVLQIRESTSHFVLISNKISSDGIVYEAETMEYQKALGNMNQTLVKIADVVIEVICGIPVCLKGKELFDGYLD